MRFSSLFSIFALALPLFVSAEHDSSPASRRHNALASRMRGDLQRRGDARLTFYAVGLGACGKTNVPSDFIVALNAAQFGGGYPGPHCFQMITITYQGKTARAQIMDRCPGCPPNGLDLSEGLFQFFAPLSTGVIYATWSFDGGNSAPPPPPPPPPPPKPKPTSVWTPPPTPTWSAPQSSWTSKTPSGSSSLTKNSSSPSQTPSKSASTDATPTTVPNVIPVYGTPSQPQNFHGLNAIVGGLGEFIAHVYV